LEIQFYNLV